MKSVKISWEELCPVFFEWFMLKRSQVFVDSVIESAREKSDADGLYYNNNVECNHFRQKQEQCFKRLSSADVVDTLSQITERQQSDEVKALYGSGPYSLNKNYVKFKVDSLKWHSWTAEKRDKHIISFRKHSPKLSEHFQKPKTSGRKPNQTFRKRKQSPDVIIDRIDITSKKTQEPRVTDPMMKRSATYELHLRSQVP